VAIDACDLQISDRRVHDAKRDCYGVSDENRRCKASCIPEDLQQDEPLPLCLERSIAGLPNISAGSSGTAFAERATGFDGTVAYAGNPGAAEGTRARTLT
jgi:hypothetical protein